MSRSTTPKLDLTRDEVITSSGLNLSVLQRHDRCTEAILAAAPNAALFQLDSDNKWNEMNVQGSFFVVKRNAPERFRFIIMNRINTENLVEDILEICEYAIKLPHLVYKNKDSVSRCILFDTPRYCEDICNVLHRISTAYGTASPKLQLSSYKSELDKVVVDPTSEVIKGQPSISAAGTSKSATQNSLLPPLVNQGSTAVTSQGTFASNTSAVGQLDLQRMLYQQSMPATRPILPCGFAPFSSAPPQSYPQYQFFPVRPADFCILHNASSPMNFAPIAVDSVIVSSQPDISLPTPLPPFYPSYLSTPNFNLTQNTSNTVSINKAKLREALMRLVMNDSFVEMVYQEMVRMDDL